MVNAEVNGKFSEKGQLCHKSVEFLALFSFFGLFSFFFFVLLKVKSSRIAIFHVLFFPASIIGLRLTQLIKIQIGEMNRDSFDNEANKQNGLKRIIWESFRCIL